MPSENTSHKHIINSDGRHAQNGTALEPPKPARLLKDEQSHPKQQHYNHQQQQQQKPNAPGHKSSLANLRPSNPYDNVANYSHEASTVPPYVLYGIAANKNDINEEQNVESNLQDPFLSSINNNWRNFFEAVDSTPAYADGVLNHDPEALGGLPDLSGKWGGGERLKQYLNDDNAQEKHLDFSEEDDHPKGKSKAGYWMSTRKTEQWIPYLKRVFLFNSYIPLFFRLFIIVLSIVALVLSVSIYNTSKKKVALLDGDDNNLHSITQQPSTIMAICVQSIALVYLIYITYDEFSSKPIGIRNPIEKMRLILLDLLFIILSSANISLSFNTLYDHRWVCTIDEYSRYPKVETICRQQKALSAFLFLILAVWVITFSISIMRVIQKVAPN